MTPWKTPTVQTDREPHGQQWRHHRFGRHAQLLQLSLLETLGFGATILEPDFDLMKSKKYYEVTGGGMQKLSGNIKSKKDTCKYIVESYSILK